MQRQLHCMASQPKPNIKNGNTSTRNHMLKDQKECRSWVQHITTVYSVRDDKSCGHDRTNHTGAHTHQREALQNHSPKYRGRCSWCSYSMRHIQRPVVCCLVSWENIVNLRRDALDIADIHAQSHDIGTQLDDIGQLSQMVNKKRSHR